MKEQIDAALRECGFAVTECVESPRPGCTIKMYVAGNVSVYSSGIASVGPVSSEWCVTPDEAVRALRREVDKVRALLRASVVDGCE